MFRTEKDDSKQYEFLKNYLKRNATNIYVVAKVYWRLMYTLAPKFEANVYISPKLQTCRLMCTLAPNFKL